MKNLKNYILHLDNWIPTNILNKTLKELTTISDWKRHEWSYSKKFDKKSKNKERELDVCYGNNLTYVKKLHDLTWKALEKYILIDKIGGEIFKGWNGFSRLRFNRYDKNKVMSKHCDHIHSLFTGNIRGIPILSIIGVLNDDYRGGDFIMFDNYKIKLKAGDLILFPSNFMYPHLVREVKEGTRYSFVSWCY